LLKRRKKKKTENELFSNAGKFVIHRFHHDSQKLNLSLHVLTIE